MSMIKTELDATAYEAALVMLHQLIMRLPKEMQDHAFGLMQIPDLIAGDIKATSTGQCVVITITPSPLLLELIAAARKPDFFRLTARYGERMPVKG